MRLAFRIKIPLDAIFSGIQLTQSFLRERLHKENVFEMYL